MGLLKQLRWEISKVWHETNCSKISFRNYISLQFDRSPIGSGLNENTLKCWLTISIFLRQGFGSQVFILSLLSLLFLLISMFWKQTGSVGLQDYPPWILLNFVGNSIYSLRKIPFCFHSTDTLIMLGYSFNILFISLTHFIFIRWGPPLPILLLLL